jgi:hypothetical protein
VTIFSLRIVEFPDVLHMDFVLKYMFGISVAVIVPLLGLVIYTTRLAIMKLLKRNQEKAGSKKWTSELKWGWKKKAWRDKWEGGREAMSASSTAEIGDMGKEAVMVTDTENVKENGNKRWPWRNRKGKDNVRGIDVDHAEKGEVNVGETNGKG